MLSLQKNKELLMFIKNLLRSFFCCLFICLFVLFSAWIDIKFPVTKSGSEFVCWRINVEIMETSARQNPPNLTTSISTSTKMKNLISPTFSDPVAYAGLCIN